MTTIFLILAAGAAYLAYKATKKPPTTMPEPTPEPPPGEPGDWGMDSIPNNPAAPRMPGTRGMSPLPATGPSLATGAPIPPKMTRTAAKGLPTKQPGIDEPEGVKLPDADVPTYRTAGSVMDAMVSPPASIQVNPIPPRPTAAVDKLTAPALASVIDQILEVKGVVQ